MRGLTKGQKALVIAAALIVAAATVLAFSSYQRPELLLNLTGLRYCG